MVDYELLGFEQVGLDIIEELGIQSQSILVTSHYEEMGLRARCEHLGVQLILKSMAGFVPITIEAESAVDAILIDDDTLIHACWEESARENKKSLALFSTAEDFMKVASSFAKNIPIYVDVSLANGVRGKRSLDNCFRMAFATFIWRRVIIPLALLIFLLSRVLLANILHFNFLI